MRHRLDKSRELQGPLALEADMGINLNLAIEKLWTPFKGDFLNLL